MLHSMYVYTVCIVYHICCMHSIYRVCIYYISYIADIYYAVYVVYTLNFPWHQVAITAPHAQAGRPRLTAHSATYSPCGLDTM